MIYETIKLSDKYPDATLTSYVSDNDEKLKIPPRKAIIVCPGGSYKNLSARESEPIAKKFFGEGLNVFLLKYSVAAGAANYAPLIELSFAIKYVRDHAKKYNINPELVFVIGFSAGGHLAASAGVLWNCETVRSALGIDKGEAPEGINRPDGILLCYPVITAGEFTHKNTFISLCGCEVPNEAEKNKFSLELYVDATTPPTFIWHTLTDSTVPFQNSLIFVNALAQNNVPFEAHFYPYGRHGLALASKETWSGDPQRLVPHVQCWFDLAINWMSDFNTIKE